MNNLPNQINLELNYFEFGFLYDSIKDDAWNRMPMRLCLKLKIIFTRAYIKHDKQAKIDLDNYQKQLDALEKQGGQNGNKKPK